MNFVVVQIIVNKGSFHFIMPKPKKEGQPIRDGVLGIRGGEQLPVSELENLAEAAARVSGAFELVEIAVEDQESQLVVTLVRNKESGELIEETRVVGMTGRMLEKRWPIARRVVIRWGANEVPVPVWVVKPIHTSAMFSSPNYCWLTEEWKKEGRPQVMRLVTISPMGERKGMFVLEDMASKKKTPLPLALLPDCLVVKIEIPQE